MTAQIQPLPTTAGDAGDFARRLLRLLGPAYSAPDGSQNAADALGIGGALAASQDTNTESLDEAFPNTAVSLLNEWEAMLGLPVGQGGATQAQRQAALLARWRTRFAGTPEAIAIALAPLNGGERPTFRETLWSECTANPAWVFVFTVRIAQATRDNPALLASVRAVIDAMKPAHAGYQITTTQTGGFFCNQATSLTNNTVL